MVMDSENDNTRPGESVATLPYRPGVGIMLLNDEGSVFVAQRIDMPSDAWQMPQGGIDKGETPLEAAWREMLEEIGTNRAELLAESRDWLTYDLPRDLATRLWRGRFRGQRQKWFAFHFTGTDRDIDITSHDHPEFSNWRWAPMIDLPALIVPFKRQLYQQLVDEFRPLIASAIG
ncbi:RNA pyrophosphohydrolase [Hypericibacter terrae]|jgi:putative (di)nucleoside polyphosphate hydrolase|uniref:RNA pyrophosphohydrolase n=2 Tax=Hypericibacter terrae TaxID=2602015 RepID=A0A5J6MQY2_9PROT|nr:RNA pyrophosphohydrolase [Hypericibacter terrae]